MIKIISFDIGNTLIEKNEKSTIEQLEQILNKDKEKFIKEYKDIFQLSNECIEENVRKFLININEEEHYNEVMQLFNKKINDEKIEIDAKKVCIIKNLRKLGYKIILISNSCKYIELKTKEYLEKSRLFDDIIYSYDVGFYKPDYRIFEFVQKKYNILPTEILHIGDSLNSDYLVAKRSGWNAILYDPKDKVTDEKIDKIKDFEEILDKI